MISENKSVKYGLMNATSCLNKYLNKKETEASPVCDKGAVSVHAQFSLSHSGHEREIQMVKMTKVTTKE